VPPNHQRFGSMDDRRTFTAADALIDRRHTIIEGSGPIFDGYHPGQPFGTRTVKISGHQLLSRIVHDINSCFKVEAAERAEEHRIQHHTSSAANVTIVASGGMRQVKDKAETR
jgi:hypothetical protein